MHVLPQTINSFVDLCILPKIVSGVRIREGRIKDRVFSDFGICPRSENIVVLRLGNEGQSGVFVNSVHEAFTEEYIEKYG
jgi:hypothetical protein